MAGSAPVAGFGANNEDFGASSVGLLAPKGDAEIGFDASGAGAVLESSGFFAPNPVNVEVGAADPSGLEAPNNEGLSFAGLSGLEDSEGFPKRAVEVGLTSVYFEASVCKGAEVFASSGFDLFANKVEPSPVPVGFESAGLDSVGFDFVPNPNNGALGSSPSFFANNPDIDEVVFAEVEGLLASSPVFVSELFPNKPPPTGFENNPVPPPTVAFSPDGFDSDAYLLPPNKFDGVLFANKLEAGFDPDAEFPKGLVVPAPSLVFLPTSNENGDGFTPSAVAPAKGFFSSGFDIFKLIFLIYQYLLRAINFDFEGS